MELSLSFTVIELLLISDYTCKNAVFSNVVPSKLVLINPKFNLHWFYYIESPAINNYKLWNMSVIAKRLSNTGEYQPTEDHFHYNIFCSNIMIFYTIQYLHSQVFNRVLWN